VILVLPLGFTQEARMPNLTDTAYHWGLALALLPT
jgi:hypothetical protein